MATPPPATVEESWIEAAEAAADAAGAVIRPFFRRRLAPTDKADSSPVTIADRTAERVIRAVLSERLPEHPVLGEEFGHSGREGRYAWVVDPLDGTRAFITGRPSFGTLIALLDEGRPVLGLIDQPITRERWIGVAGRPTRFSSALLAGSVGTRSCPRLAEAELSCTSPEMLGGDAGPRWQRLREQVRRASWGGDCYAYGLLALGQLDIVAECTMRAWDWAALVPVVEGAGGRVTDWQGNRLRLQGDGTVLAVGDPARLDEAVALLGSDPS